MSNYCCYAVGCSISTLKKNNLEKYPWLKDVICKVSFFFACNKRKNDSCRFERFDMKRTGSQTSFHGYVPNTS